MLGSTGGPRRVNPPSARLDVLFLRICDNLFHICGHQRCQFWGIRTFFPYENCWHDDELLLLVMEKLKLRFFFFFFFRCLIRTKLIFYLFPVEQVEMSHVGEITELGEGMV